jgi:NADPH-dependent 2,4-dienoyl-CoA reductase/sulfur reductase-like enzyme
MKKRKMDIVVIGAGAGGLEAAIAARKGGATSILVLDRDERLGGILHQCIHNGFGLYRYKEELTGPEYIERVLAEFHSLDIPYRINAMVLEVTPQKEVLYVHPSDGLVEATAKAVILAMGCREKTRHMIRVPGDRPAGIYTAGTAQRLMNIDGLKPGREVVVIGSGDIGLIMARRCTLSGMLVKAVVEILPYPSGLIRNVVQCLYDFDIPLLLSTKVSRIRGRKRVEGVVVTKIDEGGDPIAESKRDITCDTVLIAAGLVPENELSRKAGVQISPLSGGPEIDQNMETSVAGIFSAGDVAYIHNLVDRVSEQGETAGNKAVELYTCTRPEPRKSVSVECEPAISFVAPQRIRQDSRDSVELAFRVRHPEENARVRVASGSGDVLSEERFKFLQPSQIESISVKVPLDEKIRVGVV